MKKTDDRGVSLVELLVAVCILAIITIPILHSFVSSYRVNAKSRQTMRATTLAQNEMEIFERAKIKDIAANPAEFGFEPTNPTEGTVEPDADGVYRFVKQGIINDNSGRTMFDVYVTFDPERSGKYRDENSLSLLNMSTLSVLDSGTYVQKVKTERNRKSDDDLVYEEFKSYLMNPEDTYDFEEKLERTITLDITQEPDGATGKITKAMVTYLYRCPDAGIMQAGHEEKSVSTMIFNNAGSVDEEGNRVELKSLYLFYAPRYKADKDVIVVNNTANLPVEVYIIRQNLTADEGGLPMDPVADYQAELQINDPGVVSMWDKCTGTYYTNLNLDGSAPDPLAGRGREVDLYFNGMSVMPSPEASTRTDDLRNMGCMKLGSAQEKDRIYTMNVEVYQAGDVYGTDKPLVTMDGTKLE